MTINDSASAVSDQAQAGSNSPGKLQRILDETERKEIVAALETSRWVIAGINGAAALLGMKRSTLQVRMQKLGITRSARPA
jgi:formate hydrogenlyase transcriptional activator